MDKFIKHQIIYLKNNPEYNEKWVQEIISKDPTILNLGDLVIKDIERLQPGGGRLDLLLYDPESNRRYEVELQLGKTDESHIIRTLEYWDYQRKKFPQYDHCPVIIAEDITSRFLNVISLFNGIIPIIAIQMKAIKIESNITLFFTTVIDELTLGTVEEDEDVLPTDRNYWQNKYGKEILAFCDHIKDDINMFAPGFELKYNKFYIGLNKQGISKNFVSMTPRKANLLLYIRIEQNEETTTQLEATDLDILSYDRQWKLYRLRLTKQEYDQNRDLMKSLMEKAYKEYPK
jgi:predicted transport protein